MDDDQKVMEDDHLLMNDEEKAIEDGHLLMEHAGHPVLNRLNKDIKGLNRTFADI